MNLQKLSPDVIFLNPEMSENANKENFSIFNDITPDLTSTLIKSYNICKNIILCLPKYAKIQEIASLFSTIFKRTDRFHNFKILKFHLLTTKKNNYYYYYRKIEDITIEIEYFFINGELEQIQVYLGEITQVRILN